MKFGASLSEGRVPEWRDQYVDYKAGKKQIHKVADKLAALNDLKQTDNTPLLSPAPDLRYVPDPENVQPIERRQSIFNFSSKSSKDRKEDYAHEKDVFMIWLQNELEKVDSFYKEKEKGIYERFLILEDQFYQLKQHRGTYKVKAPKQPPKGAVDEAVNDVTKKIGRFFTGLSKYDLPSLPSTAFLYKWRKAGLEDVGMTTRRDEVDPNYRENEIRNGRRLYSEQLDDELSTEGFENLALVEPQPQLQTPEQATKRRKRDYTRHTHSVSYLYAKKQLKEALIEHYRAISLVRSYRILNSTAFRKITKKFDKAIGTTLSKDFMKKMDDESYFMTSPILSKILNRVEDVFLSYYDSDQQEQDKKRKLEKLRSVTYAYSDANMRHPHYYVPTFATGLFLGIGLPLFVLALYKAVRKTLSGEMPEGRFLLQIWGGFLLVVLMLLGVGVNLIVYTKFHINYKFIFEFDMSTVLDYKQYLMLPSFGFAALGFLSWFSFKDYWHDKLPGRDWPLLYLGIVLIVFLWPGKQFYGPSRKWLQIALWRIFCSGFYPVEFRDFYLGDILCSLTYVMGNISFFFCIYGVQWKHSLGGGGVPDSTYKCGSSHSRLMGFLSTLPSIWRFLQCVRRYMDTGDEFPHLANMLKYLVSVVYYMTLSVWRIERNHRNRVAFIVMACLNSVYSLIWDIVMDWSLGQMNLKNFLLRDHLFYKRHIYYYGAIVLDVVLRFQWIFYVFFSGQIQQLAVTSFCIAIAELLRRFIWMFFRMENEHCTNVILFRASRDSPLPYPVSLRVERTIRRLADMKYSSSDFDETTDQSISSRDTQKGQDVGQDEISIRDPESLQQSAPGHALTRRRTTLFSISDALNKAHIKDFQRKKYAVQMEDSDDEEDEEHEQSQYTTLTRGDT